MNIANPNKDPLELEIQIVDHCNQKCDNCNHFANVANEWFMEEKEFIYTIDKIKTELYPNGLSRIMLIGGEPLLHPSIKRYCEILKNSFPNGDVKLEILTNGILIDTLEDIDEIKKNVHLTITPYPDVEIENPTLNSRLFFNTNFLHDIPLGNPKEKYEQCSKFRLPCFFIRDYKLFVCPLSGCFNIYNQVFGKNIRIKKDKDYIDLHDLTYDKLKSLGDNGPECCSYCDQREYSIYWSKLMFPDSKVYEYHSPKELFLNDYKRYNIYFNGTEILRYFKENNIYKSNMTYVDRIDKNYAINFQKTELNRIYGKIDIIIPFYNFDNLQLEVLYDILHSQTIIDDCHIYLISDNSPKEEEVFDKFNNIDNGGLKVTFLKTAERSGPGVARQLGIDNSFNPYIFFFDIDDLIINPMVLEQMYQIITESSCDIVQSGFEIYNKTIDGYEKDYSYVWNPDINTFLNRSYCSLYKREFLENHNIRYNDFFLSEDMVWAIDIGLSCPKVKFNSNISYIYIRGQEGSIGLESSSIDKILYKYLVHFIKKSPVDFKNVMSENTSEELNFIRDLIYKACVLKDESSIKQLYEILDTTVYRNNLIKHYNEVIYG